jgi:hypothetical protein
MNVSETVSEEMEEVSHSLWSVPWQPLKGIFDLKKNWCETEN